ncbi:UDP-N-acetyl-D-galactosamine dehydrogenase [Flavobacterium araucananum]|uniref:UDP-N-acetyl-D-galactosamine dehydrogenase n=1 Tax=Flavobacterium araucananum TaxID=946678 RepID=A0A227PFU5_9FLAO|nr:nucleotide sugar dehydrogenase [Flavobacterium araucananum]OXG08747.1 UDP-N-acetyl-D-galactosamine dehydrogenase [Flavobacterium araucananum]PWJ97764.1 UDP-N-acetyl-D-galactosamine dehydrogenase [Flavobacterium araucananum]
MTEIEKKDYKLTENIKIAIIGLGYVGLPLARLFATKYSVIGFDINETRVSSLKSGTDTTLEVDDETLQKVLVNNANSKVGLYCTTSLNDIADCNYFIVTVPTPVDKNNRPDLTPLYKSSESVGKILKKGDIVIYESTVYPGVTEEQCVPVLERVSGLKFNQDFYAGYSPERINPGDKEHTVEKILKVTSGSTPEIGVKVDALYKSVITAGTHLAPSIKVAEAAKVIENSQRDINIAFVNELAKIFNLMNIDTQEVLAAASTKWNFLPFKPGLVGGHCIGVDPYYLAQRAQEFGYHPEIILAGRRLNDSMGEYVASQIVKLMIKKGISVNGANLLMLGITFKENCPDVRNTKIVDVVKALKEYGISVTIYDPLANTEEVKKEYKLKTVNFLPEEKFDAIVLGVAHTEFLQLKFSDLQKENSLIYDVKGVLGTIADNRL